MNRLDVLGELSNYSQNFVNVWLFPDPDVQV